MSLSPNSQSNSGYIFPEVDESNSRKNQMRSQMTQLLEAFRPKHSLVSRAAFYWEKQPYWFKVLIALLLTVPVFTAGLVFHYVPFIWIAICSAVLIPCTWFLLLNHYQHFFSAERQFEESMDVVVGMLDNSLNKFDEIYENMATEVNSFQASNTALKEKVRSLDTNLSKLGQENQAAVQSTKDLQSQCTELDRIKDEHLQALLQCQQQLESHKANLAALREKSKNTLADIEAATQETANTKTKLSEELKQAEGIIGTLKATVLQLSQTSIEDEALRSAFQTRLETVIQTKIESFKALNEKIANTKNELMQIRLLIDKNNDATQNLLLQVAQQLSRGEINLNAQEEVITNLAKPVSTNLENLSLFTRVENNPVTGTNENNAKADNHSNTPVI